MKTSLYSATDFPYCLRMTEKGKWILLNRWYKPLHTRPVEWIDYDSKEYNTFQLTSEIIEKIKKILGKSIGDKTPHFFFYKSKRETLKNEYWEKVETVYKIIGYNK
jgi:hypothetical protein